MNTIIISILSFGRPALAANVVEQLKGERRKLGKRYEIHVIIGVNECGTGKGRRYWKTRPRPRWTTILSHDHNLGFGGGHNYAFRSFPSDIFVALNDDIKFSKKGWLEDLIQPIALGKASLAGASESPCRLTEDLDGTWRKPGDKKPPDYIEASILAVNSSDARKLGLFANDLDLAYFEDSDLSLRFRQAGKRICTVSIPHVHQRGVSANRLSSELLDRVRLGNQARVRNRWERAIQKGQFSNRIAVVLDSIGWGDALASLPAALQLAADHPTSRIDIHVTESIRNFFKHPRFTLHPLKQKVDVLEGDYDRIWHLSSTPFSTPDHLGATIAASLGVSFAPELASGFLRAALQTKTTALLKRIAIVHAECGRVDFEGRQPDQKAFIPAIELLNKKGFNTVLVGVDRHQPSGNALARICCEDLRGKTSLWELAELMSLAQLCLCSDSGPLHLAQALHVPTFALFGCTLPTSKITWWDNTSSFQAKGLSCLGCYHLLRTSPSGNMCARRDVACMTNWDGKQLAGSMEAFLDGRHSGFQQAMNCENLIRSRLMERNLRAFAQAPKTDFFNKPPDEGRENVIIFGAGEGGWRALKQLPGDLEAIAFSDNDPNKWNTTLGGLPVIAPAMIGQMPFSKIVVASQYCDQIFSQLLKSGISPKRIRIVQLNQLQTRVGQ